MYFSWKNRRIVTKLAVWAAREGEASQFVYTLADAVTERVGSGQLQGPDTWGSVGLRRNAEPVEIDESDRRQWVYVCHPADDRGTFAGHPVDYKLVAPGAPVEGNRAFPDSVDQADGLLYIAASGQDADTLNEQALSALADMADPRDADRAPLHALLPPKGSHQPDPEGFRRRHDLPDRTTIRPAEHWNGDVAWNAFLDMADDLRPRLERALEEGRLPETKGEEGGA